jgi:hypothetical protein
MSPTSLESWGTFISWLFFIVIWLLIHLFSINPPSNLPINSTIENKNEYNHLFLMILNQIPYSAVAKEK